MNTPFKGKARYFDMALKNGEQYVESIQKMRLNVYKWGELIDDLTTDPAPAKK